MQENSTRKLFRAAGTAAFAIGLAHGAAVPSTENLNGRWAATLKQGDVTIPFRLDVAVDGNKVTGKLYNGTEDFETTSSAKIENGKLELNFTHYMTTITADVQGSELDGKVTLIYRSPINITPGASAGEAHDFVSPFHATRYVAPVKTAHAVKAPSIDGVWELPYESSKGEKAFRLIVKQKGEEISASILRVDGDTGALTGDWQGDKFVASHFDGSRPGLVEITPKKDGTLNVSWLGEPEHQTFTAYRPEVARAKALPEPANYSTHTTVRDPKEVFTYSFPDVNGKLVTNEDERFKGKVVLAIVTGTWCPNCHDEARYLAGLYKQYHDKGLEIVALDFEEADQEQSHTRVNAFIKQYGIPYTYLIAGTPDEMWAKVPQTVNLNTWPATLFIGKDGRVKATYSGFAGTASGIYNAELKDGFVSTIDRLLKEKAPVQSAQALPSVATVAAR